MEAEKEEVMWTDIEGYPTIELKPQTEPKEPGEWEEKVAEWAALAIGAFWAGASNN